MAKRRKRKHRPSVRYIAFKNKQVKPISIIPTITKKPTRSADYKQIRNEIRKAFTEQKRVEIEPPSKTYTSSKKKNRKEARQKRKEKKQKRKQQIEQKQQQQQVQQPQPIPPQETPTVIDYGGEIVDVDTGEILDYDDTENYLDDLQAEIEQVHQMILDDYSFDIHINERFSSLDRAYYWLDEARQLPYDAKQALIAKLEKSVHLEEIRSILSYRYYTEMENASEDIASTIQAVIEDFL